MLKFLNKKEQQLLNRAKTIASLSARLRQVNGMLLTAKLSNDKVGVEKYEKEKLEVMWERQIWTEELYKTK